MRWGDLPIVPNTTQGNVFPIMNSRTLVMSNKRPPRKMIGPLFSPLNEAPSLSILVSHESNPVPTSASPGHQAACKGCSGDNKASKCSRCRAIKSDRSVMRSRYYLKAHNGVGFPTFLARDDWRTVIGLKYSLSNCSADSVTEVGTGVRPFSVLSLF